MKALPFFSLMIFSAISIAPFIPFNPSVKIELAPKAFNTFLLSIDIVSGMVKVSLYPLAAQTKARAMPVLPLVGSIISIPLFKIPLSQPPKP